MREIKFRAWDDDLKQMIGPFEVGSKLSESYPPEMQYTGLKDKNGAEIYEGDIIGQNSLIMPVSYACCGFYAANDPLSYWAATSEIIGNIHQNPELLK